MAAVLLGAAVSPHAQVLVSADNRGSTVYTNPVNSPYQLDGSNTALSFTTAKANEPVTLSFAGARCGIERTGPQAAKVLMRARR